IKYSGYYLEANDEIFNEASEGAKIVNKGQTEEMIYDKDLI
ncbi:8304_t:CDS:1, partial [Gigaspora margarita]